MPEVYNPILRPDGNEREVIQTFGGLSRFSDTDQNLSLRPVVEVAGDEHLSHLTPFRDAGETVYVDLPEYWTRRSTKYTKAIKDTLENHGSREEFFRANEAKIDVPVVSTFAKRPVEFGIHKSIQLALEDTYPKIAHRLMIRRRKNGFSDHQEKTLKELSEMARASSDVFFFDVVDNGYTPEGGLDDNLEFLSNTFVDFSCGVFNVFNALQGHFENITPKLSDSYSFESFGDFAIDYRYPTEGGGPTPTAYLRHYYPHHGRVREFEGKGLSEAAEGLVDWDDYESDHCEWCRRAASAVEHDNIGNASKWKRIRMGHYIESALQDQI